MEFLLKALDLVGEFPFSVFFFRYVLVTTGSEHRERKGGAL